MRMDAVVKLAGETFRRLTAAAAEHNLPASHHARNCVRAAAKLWLADRLTTAVPRRPNNALARNCDIAISLPDDVVSILAQAAAENGMALELQIVAILTAAVGGYDEAAQQAPADLPPHIEDRRQLVPKRAPFDPKRYAKSAALDATLAAEEARRLERRHP